MTSLWVWSPELGEGGVVVRRRRGRGRGRLAISDSTPRNVTAGVVAGGNSVPGMGVIAGEGDDRGARKKVSPSFNL